MNFFLQTNSIGSYSISTHMIRLDNYQGIRQHIYKFSVRLMNKLYYANTLRARDTLL